MFTLGKVSVLFVGAFTSTECKFSKMKILYHSCIKKITKQFFLKNQ